MTDVFTVISGEYSDVSIRGVFSSEKNAEAFGKYLVEEDRMSSHEYRTTGLFPHRDIRIHISKMELDQEITHTENGEHGYFVRMNRNGDTEKAVFYGFAVNIVERVGTIEFIEDCIETFVYARDQKHAVKIVNEKRVQLLANNEFPVWVAVNERAVGKYFESANF